MNKLQHRNPWLWVPTLYFAEGLPYVVVMTVSTIMYKRFGLSNAEIALYTSWLYLPWTIKPFWSPFVDMFRTKRFWILITQFLIAVTLLAVAFAVPLPAYLVLTLSVFTVMAFGSATHDIAADGFYMLGLSQADQSAFVGIRSTLYRLAMMAGQGGLVVLAGWLEPKWGIPQAWSVTFFTAASVFAILSLYHRLILPYPDSDLPTLSILPLRGSTMPPAAGGYLPAEAHPRSSSTRYISDEFIRTFILFFKKKDIGIILLFLLFYRFAEAQLLKLVTPFLLDGRNFGGLGLTTSEVGVVYGTVGVIALMTGGLLGGIVISMQGLRRWLWPMVIIMHAPDLVFIYLSRVQPENFLIINCAVGLEQFGYGFGFTAYAMYMIYVSQGEYRTAHFAICTGIMALGMMLPGMISGKIQELLGYQNFFVWVLLSTIPGFIVAALVKIDPDFGRKREQA